MATTYALHWSLLRCRCDSFSCPCNAVALQTYCTTALRGIALAAGSPLLAFCCSTLELLVPLLQKRSSIPRLKVAISSKQTSRKRQEQPWIVCCTVPLCFFEGRCHRPMSPIHFTISISSYLRDPTSDIKAHRRLSVSVSMSQLASLHLGLCQSYVGGNPQGTLAAL